MSVDKKTTSLQGITDLTVLATIRQDLAIGPFESETKVERLARVLTTLNTLRQSSRESALQPSPFADSVGRFLGIHFFRFAIIPPEPASPPHMGAHRLLLNVTFDGGWETYMRIIWGPLGSLLDLIFCHCEGYPNAFESTFDDYMRWVREKEVPSAFFYADSPASIADQRYLEQLSALQRERGGVAGSDASACGLALPGKSPVVEATGYAVTTAVRVLKALYAMRPLFQTDVDPARSEDRILRRFAVDLLGDLRAWIAAGMFDPGRQFDQVREGFKAELAWLMQQRDARTPVPQPDPLFAREKVQAGIVAPFDVTAKVQHGALVLLRVTDLDRARDWIAAQSFSDGKLTRVDGTVVRTIAFTYSGLVKIGVPTEALAKLPREFIEGMEARAGVLGDLRSNHPQAWRRPRPNWPADAGAPALDLASVHLLIQLRACGDLPDVDSGDGYTLHNSLRGPVTALQTNSGLAVLHVQTLRQQPTSISDPRSNNHFGFVDGISQPSLRADAPPSLQWDDRVKAGDLFLGYANGRKDGPGTPGSLLVDGSFLVVRKLRQYSERLQSAVDSAARRVYPSAGAEQDAFKEEIRAKMMGRRSDGSPLSPTGKPGDNDFDYRADSDGAACPFASHVRRANPREARPLELPPRIARRGMSYGQRGPAGQPDSQHGLVFVAYNASIAEQFEVIQRWLAGGNSSGVSSADADPFLGVSETGRRRTFRFVHNGSVVRVDLGDQPLVSLEWGLYAFVPSIAALRAMARPSDFWPTPPHARRGPPAPPETEEQACRRKNAAEKAAWKLLLEDQKGRGPAWQAIRDAGLPVSMSTPVQAAPGVRRTPYGVLVGSAELVLEVLKDDGSLYSTSGYGDRLGGSIGLGYLGEDDAVPGRGHAAAYVERVNRALESTVSEKDAFLAALEIAGAVLAGAKSKVASGAALQIPVEIGPLAVAVVGKLCTEWFGLPDENIVATGGRSDLDHTPLPMCPGHLMTVSRYVFSPDPTTEVAERASSQGNDFTAAVAKFLAAGIPDDREAKITRAVLAAMVGEREALKARTLSGAMLGFPPTVIGNLVTVVAMWSTTRELWDLQLSVLGKLAVSTPLSYADAAGVLRERLLDAMRQSPVPYMDWRTAARKGCVGGVDFEAGEQVIIGLGSAAKAEGRHMLMFGGSRAGEGDTETHAVHACPGYRLAMGTMLGVIAALLTAGTLRPSSDPAHSSPRRMTVSAPRVGHGRPLPARGATPFRRPRKRRWRPQGTTSRVVPDQTSVRPRPHTTTSSPDHATMHGRRRCRAPA